MAEHPIEGMMGVTMEKIRQLVDANTIIGEPITVDGARPTTAPPSCRFPR